MKVVVTGIGSIGRRHLRNLRAVLEEPRILAVDPSPEARRWAKENGAAEIYESLEPALTARPAAAIVCTPTAQHADDLAACLEHGVHAYVEKPLAERLTPQITRTLVEADRASCHVVVAANLRYMPGAVEMTRLATNGRLGRLVGIYAHAGAYLPDWKPNRELRDYRRSYSAAIGTGGAMLDYAHEFDLLRWWGGEVQAVAALVRRASDLQIESEDVADVLLAFRSGVSGTLHMDYLERSNRRFVQLLFTEGRAVWDVPTQRLEVTDASGQSSVVVDVPEYDVDHCYREALRDFFRSLTVAARNGVLEAPAAAQCVQTGWDGAQALAIIDAARASADCRCWVDVAFSGQPLAGAPSLSEKEVGVLRQWGTRQPPDAGQRHPQSEALLRRAERVIPSVTQTLSKGPSQFVRGVSPIYLERGRGCRVWDVDGHEYVDWAMALGPMILGYADPDVDAAVARQLRDGPTFSLMHPLEVEVAELLTEVIPSAEMVRFLKTGSGANSAAVRIARAYTGRDVIATNGYHGWHDWSAGTLPLRRGVPQGVRDDVVEFEYNDLESLRRCFAEHPDGIAAVLMEPMCLHWPEDDFLHRVRDLAHEHGALFILDEVLTGFRMALGGAQEYFDVLGDLSIFGKALANGLPLAAVVGRRDVMAVLDEGAFVSLTHGGETLSLAAARATVEKLRDTSAIATLWERGQWLGDRIGDLLVRHELLEWFRREGPCCRFAITPLAAGATDASEARSILQQELMRRGILFGGAHVFSAAHDRGALEQTIAAYEDALPVVARALRSGRVQDYLEGPVLQPVFEPRPAEFPNRDRQGAVTRPVEFP